jgi:hypothetical protein
MARRNFGSALTCRLHKQVHRESIQQLQPIHNERSAGKCMANRYHQTKTKARWAFDAANGTRLSVDSSGLACIASHSSQVDMQQQQFCDRILNSALCHCLCGYNSSSLKCASCFCVSRTRAWLQTRCVDGHRSCLTPQLCK